MCGGDTGCCPLLLQALDLLYVRMASLLPQVQAASNGYATAAMMLYRLTQVRLCACSHVTDGSRGILILDQCRCDWLGSTVCATKPTCCAALSVLGCSWGAGEQAAICCHLAARPAEYPCITLRIDTTSTPRLFPVAHTLNQSVRVHACLLCRSWRLYGAASHQSLRTSLTSLPSQTVQ